MSERKRLKKLAANFAKKARRLGGFTDEEIINTTRAVLTAMSNQSSETAKSKTLSKDEYIDKVYNGIYADPEYNPTKRYFKIVHLEVPLGIMYVIYRGQYDGFDELIEVIEETTGLPYTACMENIFSTSEDRIHPGMRFLFNMSSVELGMYENTQYGSMFDFEKYWCPKKISEKMEILIKVEEYLEKLTGINQCFKQ